MHITNIQMISDLDVAPLVALVALQALVRAVHIARAHRALCVLLALGGRTPIVVRVLKIRNCLNVRIIRRHGSVFPLNFSPSLFQSSSVVFVHGWPPAEAVFNWAIFVDKRKSHPLRIDGAFASLAGSHLVDKLAEKSVLLSVTIHDNLVSEAYSRKVGDVRSPQRPSRNSTLADFARNYYKWTTNETSIAAANAKIMQRGRCRCSCGRVCVFGYCVRSS